MPNPRRTNPNKKKNTSQRNGKQYTWFNKLNKSVNKFAENVAKTIGKNIVVKGSGAGKNGANRTNNSNNANHHQLSSGARQVQQNSINSIASNTWNAVKNNIIVKDSGYDSSQNRNPITVINPSTYASGHKTGQQLNYNEQKGLHDYYETVDGRVELEVDRIMNGENHSKEYNELVGDVNGFFDEDPDGNGIQYSVYYAPGGGKELKAWYDKYSVKVKRLNANTGKMEKVTTFKKNSPPPPVYDKQGKKVDISQKWKYYTTYDFAVNDAVEYEHKHPVYYAGTDPKAVDSFLDAFRADMIIEKGESPALFSYVKDYMINPLMKKDYKAFFINTLVNVGETLDYLGVGARAAMAGRVTLGGNHQNDFGKDGNVVWYDNSKEGKEAQRELIRLGAADLLTAGEGSLRRKGTTKDEIRARIKAAGLWEEYKALRNAYQNSKSGELGKVVNNVKSAYSDPTKNYYMKTGNIVTDIAGEIFSDPSLVVGGIAKAAASGGSKAVAKTAARTAVRGYLPKAIEITPELDKAIDRFASTMGSDLLTANRKNIDKRVSAFSKDLFSKGLLVPNESFTGVGNSAEFLSQKISQLVKGSVDSTNFKVVKSINKLDRAIDMADMSLLKLTLPAPFLAVKGGKGLNKLYRRSLLKAFDSEMSKQFGESMSKAALKDLGTFKVSELEKLVDEMKTEPNYVDDVFNETISKAGSLSKLLQRNISDVIDGRKSYKEFDDTIDASVKSMTGVSSRSELEAYVESLLAGPLKENRAKYIQLYDSLMNSINTVKSMDKVLMEREVTLLGSELNKVNSIEELEVLANKYITRSAGVKYPEQLEELIRAKACEISGVVDKKVVDSIIADFERKHNVSVSAVKKAVDIPKTVSDNTKFGTHIDSALYPQVEALRRIVLDKDSFKFKKLREYFFRIQNIDNMDPEGLYDAIQDAIRDAYKAKGLAELSGKGSPIDDNFIMSLHEISNDLRKDLTTVISEDTRLHRWKMDKLAVFDEYMMDGRFRNVVDYLRAVDENGEPANEFSKALNKIKDVRCTPEELDSASESFKLMYDLSRKLDIIDYFNSFRSQLMAGGLDYRVQYKVLDTLFAITKGSPKNYLHKSLPQVEYFMNKLDTILNAEYGVRCSLDGARKLIKDRDTSLFEKFEKEEVDEISDWLDALVKDGHKNPINDVRVQMFYTVLKDPTMVTDYNIKARNGQPVAFLDIETTGLNKDICEITSIAVKKWNADVIDENFSLTQLRDFIEGCDEKRLVRNMADDDISKIPNSYFEDLFKDNPTVVQDRFASNGWVENYKKIYEIGSLSDERSILDGFNDIVDEISAGSVKAPTFVSHNQHGFDIPFIISRVGYWNDKIGASNIAPDKVKTVDYFGKSSRHTTDIRNASENTLARIRGIENDVLPTAEEREYIKECLVNLANNADKVTNNFKIIDPRELEHTLSTLKRTEVEEGSFGAEYLSGLANENFDRLLEPLENCSKDIGHARREFDRYIFGDPYRYDAETQVLHEYHNILKDFYKANPSRGYSLTSTDVYYDSKIARICFEEVAGSRTLCTDLNSMYIFAKEIKDTIDKDIASTAHEHLLPYKVVYDDIIEQVRDFAFQLPEYHHLSYLKNLAVPSTAVESYCVAKKLYDMVYKHFDEYSIEMYTDKPSTASIMNPEGLGLYSEIKGMKSDVDFTGFDRFGFINKFGVNEDLLSDSMYYLDHDCYSIYKNLDNTSEMYVQSFRSANFEQVKDYENASFQLTKRMRTMQTDTSLSEFSKYAKSKVAAVSNAYGLAKNIVDELSRHAATDADFWDSYGKFFDRLFKERYSQFSAYRMNRLIKDQDTFISDLAFSAGFRRVISINSEDKLHMNLVSLLEKKFKEYDDSLFSVTYESNHMVVQLKQEPLFRTDADGNRFVSFQSSTKEYAQVPEERILFEDYSELKYGVRFEYEYDIARIYNNLRDLYNEIDNLTGGASVGTMGILHRYGSEKAIVDSFSTETRMNSLGIDFSMNERFWHNYNFDKSMLGDFDSSYKIGLTVDDFDFVLNAVKVLDEISGRVKSTEHYLDSLFSGSSECRVDELLHTFSKEELLESLKLNDDIVVCRLVEDPHTESGFAVKQIHIQDAISIEEAAKTNSIFVPYDMYLDLVGHINDSQVTNTFLKAWMKFVHVGKVSMLMSFGLIIRNWIDATIKNAGAMDSLGYALSYEFEAAARLREVMRVQRKYGDIATEHDWKSLNPSNKLSYTDYEHARQFMSDEAVSGGQALRSKQILKEWEVSGRENRVLSVGGYNTVGSKSDRLEYQDVKYVENMCKDAVLFNRKLFDDMSIEEYLRVFEQQKINPKQVLDADTRFKYDKISDELVKYKSKTSYIEGDVNRAYQKLTNFVLTPMSQTELIVRYSLLMGLEDMGLSRAGAYHEIVKTHFNYNNKSLRIKLAECVVPFATFQWNNLSYWLRQMQSNPRMIRYLEHTFGELSFRDIDDLQDERGVVNNSVMNQILSGGIKIGSGGMYFKLNSSYLDALNWFYGGPSNLLNRMVPSLQLPIRGFMQYAGMDSWNIFSDIDFAQTEEEWLQDVIKSIPILREAYTKYEHFAVNRNWEFLQSSGIQKTLVKFLPSTFGVTKVYENRGFDDFDEWLEELAEDDKWYDCNTGHIVDISLRNKKGLNNPKLSAEERKRLMLLNRGMLYDANVGHYVMPTHYTEGGLNKDWDFSKEGEWDEYQRLRKKYFGQVYDYNRHKFVKANKVTKGGLNDENLDWDSLCALNAEHNRYWDSNQGMFVQKKYLTTGGLNSKNMSFPALCAYQLAIFGKKWDIGKHKFVKVTDPVIGCKFNSKYEDWKVYNTLGFDTALVVPEKFTYMGKDGILRNMDGQYVLSDNEESNEKIFAKIREEYSYSSYGRYTRRYSYRSGWADGYAYNKVPVVPSKPYRNVIQSKGKAFNRPFTSSSNYSALRMAVSGYKAYDEYYKYDYNYNYSYRNPVRNTQLKRYDYRYHN